MKDFIVIVDQEKDWAPYFPTDQIVKAKDYLFKPEYHNAKSLRVLNLCSNFKSLSLGYYSSLIAEARNHKVMPTVKVLTDLHKKKHYDYDLDELQETAQIMAQKYTENDQNVKAIAFLIYFGETKEKIFKELGKSIFNNYPAPILEVRMVLKKYWKIDALKQVHITDLNSKQQDFFAEILEKYSNKIWRLPKTRKQYHYDMAILVDDHEKLPPSNPEALDKFIKIGEQKGIYVEKIHKHDLARLNEFDALFIRTTTSINNYTYIFSKKAQDEGIVVIDDPNSMLKCTNKIFLYNLFERKNVNKIKSLIVSDYKEETLKELEDVLKFPMVLKIPDGSFSLGVSKVNDLDELKPQLKAYLEKSSLILVQEFFYTDYDWRIGIIGGKPFFACKYFMSKGHWQIYNHTQPEDTEEYSGNTACLAIPDVPKYVIETALKACEEIGDGLYGVDIKDDGSKAYVVEVNDNPNLDEGYENELIKDEIYHVVLDHFINKIEQARKN